MSTIDYVLMDPTGNRTLLVRTPVEPCRRKAVATALMAIEPTAEQVGFLQGHTLAMAGGEFCGNASMAAAALLHRETGETVLRLQVSGAPDTVTVDVTPQKTGVTGRVAMPPPLAVEERSVALPGLPPTLPVVHFPGILHAVVEAPLAPAAAEAAIRLLCRQWQGDALGLMLLDKAAGTLRPLVFVPAADTLVWESSCASGTAAIGAWLYQQKGQSVRLSLQEPGGSLTVEATPKGLWLTGTVRSVHTGSIYLSEPVI